MSVPTWLGREYQDSVPRTVVPWSGRDRPVKARMQPIAQSKGLRRKRTDAPWEMTGDSTPTVLLAMQMLPQKSLGGAPCRPVMGKEPWLQEL